MVEARTLLAYTAVAKVKRVVLEVGEMKIFILNSDFEENSVNCKNLSKFWNFNSTFVFLKNSMNFNSQSRFLKNYENR